VFRVLGVPASIRLAAFCSIGRYVMSQMSGVSSLDFFDGSCDSTGILVDVVIKDLRSHL